jgi:PKD repeat protein
MTLDSLIPDRDSALVNEDIVWTFNAGNAAALHYVLAAQNGNPVAAGELTEEREIRWTAQAAGEYALTLTATDEAGATLTAFSFVSITATELAATVASEAGYAVLGTDTLHFETGVTGGTLPYAIHYNLDLNGSTAYEQDGFAAALQYTPAEAGTYTFTMTVSDANGAETTAQCTVAVADINAVEQQSDWEAGLAGAALTGDYAADLLAVAGTQLGYAESAANFILDENGEAHAYTRYGAWYGDPYGDWNAMFLSFCANYAGIPEGVLPEAADSDAYESAGNGYVPAAGDVVFFTDGRTGIVSDVQVAEDGSYRFFAIEGDLSGTVGQAEYEGSDSRIAGYANMAVAQYGEPAAEPDASETDQIWTDLAAGAELTNEWRDDLLAVARTQIGYQESEADVSLDEAGNASGYTLYGRLMGDAHMDWNAAFAAFVTLQAGVSDAPTAADAQSWLNQAKARGMYYGADYEAQPGDLIFLDTNADGAADRVGIVEVGAYDGQLIAIEGDLDGASGRVSYAVNDARILGYENPVTTLTDEATGVSVTGVLPAAAVLSVTPVKIDTPDAEAAAAGEGQTEENATIEEGETAEECITTYTEGNNVVKRIVYDINLGGYQPCKNVTVIMPLPEDFGGEPTVYHYDGETYEREEEMEGEPSEDGGQYTFVTSHFSLLGAESITLLAATPGVLSTVDSISDGITINVLDYGPTTLDVSSNNYNSPSYTGINNYYGQYSTRDKRYTNVLFFGYGTSGGTTLNHYSGGKRPCRASCARSCPTVTRR